jgi:hypothetical protein
MPNKLKLKINYQWIDLKNKKGDSYQFPDKRGTLERKILENPGVYRWVKIAKTKRKIVCLYIGESSNLYSRIYGYIYQHKSQATSYSVGRKLRKLIKQYSVKFQMIQLSASLLAGEKISQDSLSSMHIRQAIEQSLIVYYKNRNRGECKFNKEKSNRYKSS